MKSRSASGRVTALAFAALTTLATVWSLATYGYPRASAMTTVAAATPAR